MKKQHGFTLIELMLAITLGLIVIAATIGIYITTIKGSTDTINSARLNYDLDSLMSLMVNDIRRAGYWGGAVAGANSATNPFTIGIANIQIPTAGCILYTYDADADGIVDANEYYGFKRVSSSSLGSVLMRTAGTTTADCSDGSWETLTLNSGTQSLNITTLTFDITAYKCLNVTTPSAYNGSCAAMVTAGLLLSGEKAIESRQIDIVLSGQLVNDPNVTKTLNGTVKVRNDRIFKQ